MSEEILEATYDGKAARAEAEKKSERSDMKQHADKLYQGYKKLQESDTRRAVWELFQNAIDLSENCEVVINEEEDTLEFTHNGKLFNSDTLISLIKQVSSKSIESNEKEIGQYGTGFITTHSFGRKIILNSFLKESGRIIPVKDFEIDRTCENNKPEQLIDKLINQRNSVFEMIEAGNYVTEFEQKTTFKYLQETDRQAKNVTLALDKLNGLLPYVMIFNENLKKVTVNRYDESVVIYEKGDNETTEDNSDLDCRTITINKNGKPYQYYYLQSKLEANQIEPELTVVLPFKNQFNTFEFNSELSKLFLCFPLIGTENFGINFLIHSKHFKCTEPRDGLYLNSTSEENQLDEKANQDLLYKASKLVFNFIKDNQNQIINPIHLAKVNFDRITKEVDNENEQLLILYFKQLQKEWIDNVKVFKLVETENDRISVEAAYFISEELLKHEEEDTFNAIYHLVSKYWNNIPQKDIAIEWTNIVNDWSEDTINYVTIDKLIKKIEEEKTLNSFVDYESDLKNLYRYLIETGNSNYFDTYKVLPNIDNDFIDLNTARIPVSIDQEFIEIAKVLIPEVTNKFIKDDFIFTLVIEVYERDDLDKDIRTKNTAINNSISKSNTLNDEDLLALINYCSIFPQIDNKGKRGEIIDLIGRFHELTIYYKEISNVTDKQLDFIPVTRSLIRDTIFRLQSFTSIEIAGHLDFLHELLNITYDSYDYKDTVLNLAVYPNQLNELKEITQISKDLNIPKELKNLYNKILTKNLDDVRATLLLEKFNDVIKTTNIKTAKNLADEIYGKFIAAGKLVDFAGHTYEDDIFGIVENISNDSSWADYFPDINAERSVILMKKVTDDAVKDNLFKIIGSGTNKISILGKLSQRNDLEYLVKLGEDAIESEKRYNADFAHKKKIGIHIERLVREQLNKEVDLKFRIDNEDNRNVGVDEVQGGQDIVIEVNGSIIYYIEVKSRWDSNNSVFMSKLQLERASKNTDKYALCSVDMTKYKGVDKYNVEEVNEIIEFIRFVEDIGTQVDSLVSNNILAESLGDNVRLTDYRGLIPQWVINNGIVMGDFITGLCELINSKLTYAEPN